MKIGIFGCGAIYQKYKNYIISDDEVVAILDNNIKNHEDSIDGYKKIHPRDFYKYQMDIIILMSDYASEMREQLIRYGCCEDKLLHYKDYFGSIKCDRVLYYAERPFEYTKTLLIISNELGFHGGTIVALRTAKCAMELGYKVTIAASKGQMDYVKELQNNGINVCIQKVLQYSSWDNLKWTNEYDVVIVNTFPMVRCAIEIAKNRKVILWIHESLESYYPLEFWHNIINAGLRNDNIIICAVSKHAVENLHFFYGYDIRVDILPVAIEDWKYQDDYESIKENHSHTYAVIGGISRHKGQKSFLNAVKSNDYKKENTYFLIGSVWEPAFFEEIRNDISSDDNIIFLGEKTQKELQCILKDIDIVVVPSMEESFSMAAAEAMMMEKICIITDNCGISEYIVNGINGFIYKTGCSEELCEIMNWCDIHRIELLKIGKNARKTYENYFSMEIHKNNLQRILCLD